jgi:predicted amidohydrolase
MSGAGASVLDVALVQLRTPATQAAALEHAAPLIREAAARGAKLVMTPEGTNFLQQNRAKRAEILSLQDEDVAVIGLRELARELGVWLLIGSAIVLCEDDPGETRGANRSLLIDPKGAVQAAYDKMHVYDVDLPTGERHRESEAIRPGGRAVVADTPWGKLGLTICYDMRFPHLYRALARGGAEMIAVPAAFTVPTGQAHWEVLLRARAIETGCFVMAPAQGGTHEDGRRTWGRSLVVGPWGQIIAAAADDRPQVITARIDLAEVAAARAAIAQLKHDREFTGP